MVAQAIKTGPAMKRHLEAHGISHPMIVERRRSTGFFHTEFFGPNMANIQPGAHYAELIKDIPGVRVVQIYRDTHAEWRPGAPVIMAALDLEIVETPKQSIPTEPVICTHTKFSVGQTVRIAGTSHKLPIAEVKELNEAMWYRFEIAAGAVQHQWFAEERLTGIETNLPARTESFIEAVKYPLMIRDCVAIVPYGMFQNVA